MYKHKKEPLNQGILKLLVEKIRLYQNQYTNAEYQQTDEKLRRTENFRICQKSITILEHFALVRVFRICYTVREQSCYRVADL